MARNLRAARPKVKSRNQRWMDAAVELRTAYDRIEEAANEFNSILANLRDIQSEYEDWQGNLPENLAYSAVGEKLDAIVDLDLDDIELDEFSEKVDEVEGVDLPLGFGRD